jgi:nucleolar complex protein 2
MGKQSKRSRKFQASGGVAARLKKGTITKHGKLKRRAKSTTTQAPVNSSSETETSQARDRSDDLTETKNLGGLDLDAFFNRVADTLEKLEDDDDMNDVDTHNKKSTNEKDEDDNNNNNNRMDESYDSESDTGSDNEAENEEDEEGIEAAEARMKKEMAHLMEKDPDFHKFLQENEHDLLNFGQEDDPYEEDGHEKQMDISKPSEDEEMRTSNETPHATNVLDISTLDKLRRGVFGPRGIKTQGIKSFKKLVKAYESGCHLADTSTEGGPGRSYYVIESSKVFDNLMLLCLSRCHEAFHWHLLGKDASTSSKQDAAETNDNTSSPDPYSQPIPPHKLENADKWTTLKPVLRTFFRSTNHLLNESKEPDLLAFVLKSLAKYIPLLTPLPQISEVFLKTLTNLWSAAFDSNERFQIVRLHAFFRIRQLTVTQPFPFIETVLKKTYLAYNDRAVFGSSSSLAVTLPTLTFMGNCLVELYSLDFQSSYQHAFVYIRELALQLRKAVVKKSPEAIQQVFGWQFLHSLKLWVAVLADAATKEDDDANAKMMSSLLYPLAEIILGMVRNMPSPIRLFPLRVQCIRLLQQLASSSQVFLPTTSLILECFDWKEWYTKPKKSTKRNTLRGGLPIYMLIKLPKEDPMRTQEQLEAAIVQVFTLIDREMELYRYTAAFPEFSVQIRRRCRDFAKAVQSSRWKTYAKGCMEKSDELALFCTQERAKLAMAPKDVTQLECLRPSHIPTMRERHKKELQQGTKSSQ